MKNTWNLIKDDNKKAENIKYSEKRSPTQAHASSHTHTHTHVQVQTDEETLPNAHWTICVKASNFLPPDKKKTRNEYV